MRPCRCLLLGLVATLPFAWTVAGAQSDLAEYRTVDQAVTAGPARHEVAAAAVPGFLGVHVGADGVAGPVVCNAVVPVNASNDFNFSISCDESNIVLRPEIGIRSFEDFLQAVLGENAYVNIHSAVFPGGEVRGQLRRRRD